MYKKVSQMIGMFWVKKIQPVPKNWSILMKILCLQSFFFTILKVTKKHFSVGFMVYNVLLKVLGHISIAKMDLERQKPSCFFFKKKVTLLSPLLYCFALWCRPDGNSPLFIFKSPTVLWKSHKTQKPISRKYLLLNSWFWMWLTNVLKYSWNNKLASSKLR